MDSDFSSDNTAGAAPELLHALADANLGPAAAYGSDRWSQSLSDVLSELFGRPAFGQAVATGTAANSIALAVTSPRHGVVLCHHKAHIMVDECMAPGFFNPGMKLLGVPGPGGKMDPAILADTLDDFTPGLFSGVPSVLCLTQCTELGQVYSIDELSAMRTIARSHSVPIYLDGARLANALAALNTSPREVYEALDPQTIALGLTKNGGLMCEVLVSFDEEAHRAITFMAKQSGHLVSKHRFLSAQLHAVLKDDLWFRLAQAANNTAAILSDRLHDRLLLETQANEVFVTLSEHEHAQLESAGIIAQPWNVDGTPGYRLVTSWSTTEDDIERLCHALEV